MEKDPDGLVQLLEQMEFFLPSKASDEVIRSISQCDRRYDAILKERTFIERVKRFGSLVSGYSRSFERLLQKYRLKPGSSFDWLAKNYGDMFQKGADETVEGVEYSSRAAGPGGAYLIMFPTNNYFDALVREYERIRPPSRRKVEFDKDKDRTNPETFTYFRNVYINIKI